VSRGQLRIYMGAAPGVGKTYAMLNEGWRRQHRGTDVIVAFLETHGRTDTAAQVRDLEVVPRRVIQYRGQDFEEMDLDAVLARAPKVALVDELAHTNVPGSRHEKRWQDIGELLGAGIDVISTVNVQHLESLNDVVERITGVTQRETVPDAVVRAADQIELIDMTPEALRRRMAHGHIYAAEKVDAALGHYFRLGNLGALRELALLWVADRVDEGLHDYRERHGLTEPWETRERVVVALTGAPGGERLVRRGARLAARSHAELVGVHVLNADGLAGPDQELLEHRRELLEELGGRFVEITGGDIADALVRFAVSENATQLLMGSSQQSRWAELTRGSVINRVIRAAAGGPIDVHVISSSPSDEELQAPPSRGSGSESGLLRPRGRRPPPPGLRSHRSTVLAWALALLGVPLVAVGLLALKDAIGVPGMLLLLLLAPVGVAMLGGMRPALVGSVVAFVLADWFYFVPTSSLRLSLARDAVALVVFAAVAALVSGLVDRLARRSAELARGRAEAETLAALASGAAVLDHEALHRLVRELTVALHIEAAAVLVPTGDGWRVEASAGEPVPTTPDGATYATELSGGSTLVVTGPPLAAEDRRLLGAFVSQLRLAQSTLRLQAEAASAAGLTEANNVRDAILAAVSHDLRGPLANIKAAATSMLSDDVEWPRETVLSFCKTIDEEVDRLTDLVSNLLDMTRLQSGMLGVRLEAVALDEVVYAALASLGTDPSAVEVLIPEGLPPAWADRALLERALANVIANAVGWAPEGTGVRVQACAVGGTIEVNVVDRGAGIPPDQRENVFRPFQRLGDGGRATHDGIGLGLAVTKGFADAMGAEVTVEDTPGGGTTMVITMPVASATTS
jgi:two-component system, OmpR family, sensor histidine kinase KdpD